MARIGIIVSAELPPGVTIAEWKDYVLTEVRAGVGAKSPDDPLFHLNCDSVRVTGTIAQNPPAPFGQWEPWW